MPLVEPKPTAAVERAFRKGLEEMIHMDRAPAGLTGCMVQRVYVLTLKDVAHSKDLSAVRPGPWRFVTGSERGPAVAITVPTPARGYRPKMASMETGREIHQSFKQVSRLKNLPAVRRRRYELRSLRLPGIIGAFWLVPEDGSPTDLVVPFATVVPGLKGMNAYPVKTFLDRVRPIAKNRLENLKGRN